MRETLTIATRGSKLALWQAEHISARIGELNPDIEIELLVIKTKGDKILDVPLAKVGGKGLFVKEIEEALLDGRADLAVHSLKDVPAEQPPGLILGITPRREELSDRLLSVDYHGLEALPHGARIGTSSLRRKAQLLMRRPDLDIVDLRGNLDTRVGKLLDGQFAAIVVAAAGLNRLGLGAPKSVALAPPDFLPAAGQGALCLEYRRDDDYLAELLAPLDHPETRDAVAAERGFLGGLDGGCQVPIAAWGRLCDPETIRLTGFVSDTAGQRVFRLEAAGPRTEAAALGRELAERLKALGAGDVLAEVYGLERGQDRNL